MHTSMHLFINRYVSSNGQSLHCIKLDKATDAAYASEAMAYVLEDTEWEVGTVEVTTKRTWTSSDDNALSLLRSIADLHGGDLVFDCANRP